MYSFKIKAEASDIDIPAGRTILCLSLLLIVFYGNIYPVPVTTGAICILLAAAFFTAHLIVKYRIGLVYIAAIATLLTAIVTQLFILCGILFIISAAVKYFYVQPVVDISQNGISIKKTFLTKQYNWNDFNNVVLKDNLLTLDFTNNKVLQLETDGAANTSEKEFNNFCGSRVSNA